MLHLSLVVASTRPTWPDILVFAASAAVILVGAVGVVTSRNPVHAALSLVMTLFGVAVLFIEQEADFLAAVQIIVYAGAIVVLFLFVIMFLGVDRREDVEVEPLAGQRPLAFLMLGITLAGIIAMLATAHWVTGAHQVVGPIQGPITKHAGAPSGEVAQLGKQLFTTYLFAFEATAALLVIAVVGAVVLARRPTLSESELAAKEQGRHADVALEPDHDDARGHHHDHVHVHEHEHDHVHEQAEPGVSS